MNDTVLIIVLAVVYVVLIRVVLPKLGVPT